jgi:hypothetical protein
MKLENPKQIDKINEACRGLSLPHRAWPSQTGGIEDFRSFGRRMHPERWRRRIKRARSGGKLLGTCDRCVKIDFDLFGEF